MLRNLCLIGWLALPVSISLVGIGTSGVAAQEAAPDARQLCAGDAMRLCSEFIPDVPKITKCMIAKYREVSAPCRLAMSHGRKIYRHAKIYRRPIYRHPIYRHPIYRHPIYHNHRSVRRVACPHGKACPR